MSRGSDTREKKPASHLTAEQLEFRPESYWESPATVLSTIKGVARKHHVKNLLEQGLPEKIPAMMLEGSLPDDVRTALGRIHPQLMGGEYLPDCLEDEVEIARVCYNSTLADVTSVRARRVGPVFCYRIANEHDFTFDLPFDRSEQPLTQGRLIEMIDGTGSDDGTGLTISVLKMNYDLAPEECLRGFVSVDSDFYPEIGSHYWKVCEGWLDEREAEQRAERGEVDDDDPELEDDEDEELQDTPAASRERTGSGNPAADRE